MAPSESKDPDANETVRPSSKPTMDIWTLADVVRMAQHITGVIPVSSADLAKYDINEDVKITLGDMICAVKFFTSSNMGR